MALDLTPRQTAQLDAYASAFAALMPTGKVWSRDRDHPLIQYLRGQASIWALNVVARASTLVEVEALPDTTTEMLTDWERVAGLPEECYDQVEQSPEARRSLLLAKLTSEGGQSPAYFVNLARSLGHPDARITEFSPFRAGRAHCGSSRFRTGAPDQRYVWRMHVGPSAVSWFRLGKSRCGSAGQAKIRRAAAVECMIRKLAPAHTTVIFTYSFPGPLYPKDIDYFRAGKSHAGIDPQARATAWGDFTDLAPLEVERFRTGRNRCGRDPQARRVTVVTH